MAQLTTTARFECPECGELTEVEVDVPEVDWCVEPLSDSLTEDDTDIQCGRCGESFSAHVQNSPAGCFIELDEYPEVEINADEAPFSADGPDEEDWLNEKQPERPYKEFINSYHHLGDVLAEYGDEGRGILKNSGPVINRMVFASAISAMEAYLNDTLVNAVSADPVSMERLVAGDKVLAAERISLEMILKDSNVVFAKVQGYLQGLLYHNLAKVGVIYKIALNVDIFSDAALKTRLHQIVKLRHDVVHRNGRDESGIEHNFTTMLVRGALNDIHSLVEQVEDTLFSIRS
ncbi:hypothetical protein [Pseudomonas sp. 24 E 13]|uniref:hypothetical protein n=1 Tax=Pseudomonas sp. 24 E 13 TaxID=1844095 RepID=UPI00081BFAC7|nr:hypothetical protein [Pseudomonas sp. 24 E 13]